MDISRWKARYPELSQIFDDQKISFALEAAGVLEKFHVWEDPEQWEMAIALRAAHLLVTQDQQLAAIASQGANLAADRAVSLPTALGPDDLTSTVYGQLLDRMKRSLPIVGIGFL